MKLIQEQTQRLSQKQLQSIELLQMSALELWSYIREVSLENPLVEVEESLPMAQNKNKDDELLAKLRWLEENDRQNQFYQRTETEELEPINQVSGRSGLEEDLFQFICRQLDGMSLREKDARTLRYLAACLDDDGYFRIPLEELSQSSGIPLPCLEKNLQLLQSLEPAGIGARDLSQCLELQLQRIHETGPALEIVHSCLDLLAKHHYKAISAKIGLSLSQISEAEKTIRELEPRPGAVFQQPEHVTYIFPDIFVDEADGRFSARMRWSGRPIFTINPYYQKLLDQTEDPAVKKYLTDKLHQVEGITWALEQRESTLLRCANVVIKRQEAFFRKGPAALVPLRMADVAQELGIHESTVSRAMREKYLQCSKGIFPMSYFFSRPATEKAAAGLGGAAAQILLKQIVDQEDKAHPLSDQALSVRMSQEGCPVSRRTVSKYRALLRIPDAAGRRGMNQTSSSKDIS